ncbi:hypothetical protein EZ449_08350 [Pedobacter frigidisoli]|uniref:Uncharacterized protein n=1 Tax=Pedobacter frigidisoli TaxID=2530455 RepID=A0A4R0P634_9SPHI|nr:hypothetical protein [Pedobacter frigidisoli]TCD10880.1 hypothetical protein EZ449_08350 [Pedobacter frigidisoli]
MKEAILYTLKICITTFAVTVPVTMAIGIGYISLMMALNPSNFNFSFNLGFIDVAVFTAITALFILFKLNKTASNKKQNDKNNLLRQAFVPIFIFILYLLIAGKLQGVPIDNFLFSYSPMFVIMFFCMKLFPLYTENLFLSNENNELPTSAQ